MDYAKESLRLHGEWKGKIEVVSRVPVKTKDDLSLAYTPGVAQPCLEIQKDVNKSYELTRRHNMCLVVTDGTAVLGLGDIGPEAGMPVMEGKCVLFKEFGDVDAFPMCIKSKDVDEIVNTIYMISGSFGGVNLEDISAPRCFEIEKKLKEKCDIPIFHDDQHGTAIITLAGLNNAMRVVGKKKEDVQIVVNGAGAAAISITKLLLSAGGIFLLVHHNSIQTDYRITLRLIIVGKFLYIFFYKIGIFLCFSSDAYSAGSGVLIDLSLYGKIVQIICIGHIVQIAVCFPFFITVSYFLVVALVRIVGILRKDQRTVHQGIDHHHDTGNYDHHRNQTLQQTFK